MPSSQHVVLIPMVFMARFLAGLLAVTSYRSRKAPRSSGNQVYRVRALGLAGAGGLFLAVFILGAVKLCHLWRGYKAPARASAPRKLSVLSMVYLALECTF